MFKKILPFFALLFVACGLLSAKPIFAKDYSITSADFKVQLQMDGSADITEERTYYFDGSYTWADEWINLKSNIKNQISKTGTDYKISNFELWEGEEKYIESNLSSAGNFSVTNDSEKFYIKWYYRANFESKTFTLKYKIENAITNHQDIAELYWQLIGDKWTKSTGKVVAEVLLPTPAPDDQVWAFGHGPLNGIVSIPSNQKVTFSVSSLPAGKYFEVRVLFPKLKDAVYAQAGSLTLEKILSEEESFISKTQRKITVSKIPVAIGIVLEVVAGILFLAGLIKYLLIWRREGSGKPLPRINLADKLHEPPSELPPAMVEGLLKLSENFSTHVFLSTILSLVQKRVIRIKSEKDTGFFGQIKYEYSLEKAEKYDLEKLKDFEKELLDFVFDKAGSGQEVEFEMVKKYTRDHPSASFEFFKSFKKDAFDSLKGSEIEKVPLEIRKKKNFLILKSYLVQVVVILLIVGSIFIGSFNLGNLFPIIIIFSLANQVFWTVILYAVFPFNYKRTEKGEQEAAGWLAFKRWLKDYSVTKNYPVDSIILWEKYLVYGTLFGISLKTLSSLLVSFANEEFSGVMMASYGVSHSGDLSSFSASLNSSFNSLGSSFANSFSGGYGAHGVGSSGGFSGGGGGGGGGGGAG